LVKGGVVVGLLLIFKFMPRVPCQLENTSLKGTVEANIQKYVTSIGVKLLQKRVGQAHRILGDLVETAFFLDLQVSRTGFGAIELPIFSPPLEECFCAQRRLLFTLAILLLDG
jgi:hypothetical protein